MQATITPDPKFCKEDIFDKLEKLFENIDKWFRSFRHKKEIKKIQDGLLSDPKLLLDTKQKFEAAFGVTQYSRTAKQWQNLVRVYGMETVCKTEKMTEDQIANKMIESFTKKVRSIR